MFILQTNYLWSLIKRITIPEIKQDPWFLKNLPEEIIEAEKKGYVETKMDQPSQNVEEIMRIIQEARVQGSKAGDGGEAGTGSMNVRRWDDDEIDVRDDYENVWLRPSFGEWMAFYLFCWHCIWSNFYPKKNKNISGN